MTVSSDSIYLTDVSSIAIIDIYIRAQCIICGRFAKVIKEFADEEE